MYCDNIIEAIDQFPLMNMVTTDFTDWVSATSAYGIVNLPYSVRLKKDHYYYLRCYYKFTTSGNTPTWATMYIQDGSMGSSASVSGQVADTEYFLSGFASGIREKSIGSTFLKGCIYHGPSSVTYGTVGYIKEAMVIDVTDLKEYRRYLGLPTTDTYLKTVLDELPYTLNGTFMHVDMSSYNSDHVSFYKGNSIAGQFVEPSGMTYYSTSLKSSYKITDPYFDTTDEIAVYNNGTSGTVTKTRIEATSIDDNPFFPEHKYYLKVVTNGYASPYAGGIRATHLSYAGAKFVEKIVAKIPLGYSLYTTCNSQGDSSTYGFIGSNVGTGDWAEYTVYYQCGSSGDFSTGGHLAVYSNGTVDGTTNTDVTWYIAYANSCDITTNPDLRYFSLLNNMSTKGKYLFTPYINNTNLFINGDLRNHDSIYGYVSNGSWTIDTEDYTGNAFASFVQPVGVGSMTFSQKIPIDPSCLYKISGYFKCLADMSSFLIAIFAYNSSGRLYTIPYVCYLKGSLTTLASDLNEGDTTITLTSSSGWYIRNYSLLGFRSASITPYHDSGIFSASSSSGIVSSISGNVITLHDAYTGTTRSAGTYICEGYYGGYYPYPIQQRDLPTDNNWKYIENTFGCETNWSGESSEGWIGLPYDTSYIQINVMYTNTGTVPLKMCDLKIEKVNGDYNYSKCVRVGR